MICKDWDINENRNTGRFNEGKPIIEAIFKNGLNDIDPDGSFVPCDEGISEVTKGVTHLEMNRGRMGELRFGDSGHPNSFLVKIKNKALKGASFKYTGADGASMTANNGRPLCHFDNGISIESTPYYKGVKMDIIINDPLTAPLEYPFSVKTYGQDYDFIEENGGATLRGEDQAPIFIKPPYAVDANGDIGPVTIHYTGIENNLITFKKVVDEEWFREAAAPVRIDPDVTIDDSTGTFEDASLFGSALDLNSGAWNLAQIEDGFATERSKSSNVRRVDLSAYSGITVLNGKYSIYMTVLGAAVFDYELFPILRQWNEGNKSLAAASPGEVTARSARDSQLNWTTILCGDSGTDHDPTSAGDGTLPIGLGWFDMPLTAASIQAKIDNLGTNYGDVMHVKTPSSTGSFYRWHSSEGTPGLLPSFSMEFTEGEEVKSFKKLGRGLARGLGRGF